MIGSDRSEQIGRLQKQMAGEKDVEQTSAMDLEPEEELDEISIRNVAGYDANREQL